MKLLVAILLGILPLALSSCNLKEKYARHNAGAQKWLDVHKGAQGMNISGTWNSDDDDWGAARFEQNGNEVNGAIGHFQAKGYTKGSEVFLSLADDGWVYYTVHLKKSGNRLQGFYSESIPFSDDDRGAIILERVSRD